MSYPTEPSPHPEMPSMRPLAIFCAGLSALLLAVAVLFALWMSIEEWNSRSGYFAGLGYVLAAAALGAGVMAAFVLNLLAWALRYRPSWLRRLLWVQAVPALLAFGWCLATAWTEWRNESARNQALGTKIYIAMSVHE